MSIYEKEVSHTLGGLSDEDKAESMRERLKQDIHIEVCR